jgi:hypothetical protein
MRAAIKIELAKPDPQFEMLHQFRNFGEDVYRALKEFCPISLLQEVDRATSSFVVRGIRRQDIGTVTDAIKRVIRHYRWEDMIRLVRVDREAQEPPPN